MARSSAVLAFSIPAGSTLQKCRSCQQPVYWITTPKGKAMPVIVSLGVGRAPSATEPGYGISHFIDCPDSKEWSGSGPGGYRD